MTSFKLYFNTIRYLRPGQILNRVQRRLVRPSLVFSPAPKLRRLVDDFVSPISTGASLVEEGVFRFLNVQRSCTREEDWNDESVAKLWTYNLHYFDDLNADGAQNRVDWHKRLIRRWIEENRPPSGIGWEPYPSSRRIVNWIKWAWRGNDLDTDGDNSLATQVRWLEKNLERHLLGNHLLANAKALVFAGLYFDGPEADGWFRKGRRILEREMREQILEDGAHFELTPMYHAAVLEDVLDIVNVLRAFGSAVPPEWFKCISRMRVWLLALTHPDGGIAFFNDSAFGISPAAGEIDAYSHRLRLPYEGLPEGNLVLLRSSGYARCMMGRSVLLCDCAAIGPDYLPGHAHADSLSFEFSRGMQRVFVNSGTSVYGEGAERQRQRGTAAHNTVVVDGHDSSEMWAGFRVARRAHTVLLRSSVEDCVVIEAKHDGYRRFGGGISHFRKWVLSAAGLEIVDKISGGATRVVVHFHLHPAVRAEAGMDGVVTLVIPDEGMLRMSFNGSKSVVIVPGTWHPEFGVAVKNMRIEVLVEEQSLSTVIEWGG